MQKILLLSSSRAQKGAPFFGHAKPHLETLLNNIGQVLFIPYAAPGGIPHAGYTAMIAEAFQKLGLKQAIQGIEAFESPREAVSNAEAFIVGGGNTFLLLKTLYHFDLLPLIKERVEKGAPYIGSSAGSNIAGLTINTSNDMCIVHPPSLDALAFFPFNINPHYPLKESEIHSGETRAQRIQEFHALPQNKQPVVALYESSMLLKNEAGIQVLGVESEEQPAAWVFERGKKEPGLIKAGQALEIN